MCVFLTPSRQAGLATLAVMFALAFVVPSAYGRPRSHGEKRCTAYSRTTNADKSSRSRDSLWSKRVSGRCARHDRLLHGDARHRCAVNSLSLSASEAQGVSQSTLLGQDGVEPATVEFDSGRAVGFELTAVRSGAVAAAQVYLDPRNGATSLLVGLYSNASGRPGTLL